MIKAKVWGMLSVLLLSLFSAGSVFAADDELPEPLTENPPVQQNGN